MVTSLSSGRPARAAGYEMLQYVSGRHTLTAADTPAATKIGSIPAGAIIVAVASKVATAVTGGTPVLGVGTSTATVGTNGTIQNVMAEAAGSEWLTPLAALVMPLAADTDVFVGTTGGATAGDVYVAVAYITPVA
jgi:hypothetical protein